MFAIKNTFIFLKIMDWNRMNNKFLLRWKVSKFDVSIPQMITQSSAHLIYVEYRPNIDQMGICILNSQYMSEKRKSVKNCWIRYAKLQPFLPYKNIVIYLNLANFHHT